jgi:predicted dehydrogenase
MNTNRRSFLQQATAGGLAAPFFVRNLISAPPSKTVRLGSFGGGGMAFVTLDMLCTHPSVKLACVADVDSARLGQLNKKYPDVKVYKDWREMLMKEHRNLDAVCVGTPDHMHAPMAMTSMAFKLPVYGQKPLAHDIFEVRKLTETARKRKLVTQMGIQIHSRSEYKTAVQLVQTGAFGKVKEVHSWSSKKWGDMDAKPDRTDPVPETLDWDMWIGTAEKRPFIKDYYHPVNWRKRLDFGTATFGDMGCHIYDPVFSALQLTAPTSVRSEGPPPTQNNWAINAIVHYVFPGTPYSEGKTVKVTWYDGDAKPPQEVQALLGERKLPDQGSIFIGTNGVMLLEHVGKPILLPEKQFADFKMPEIESVSHYHEFVDAVMGKGKTSTHWDYAGPLTETVLLGPLATRFPNTTLEWDAKKLKFDNSEASQYVRRIYRKGWEVKGLS